MMKNQKNHLLSILLCLSLITLFAFQILTDPERLNLLLDVQEIQIDKNQPAIFKFSLDKSNTISVNCQLNTSARNRGDLDDVEIKIKNLGTQSNVAEFEDGQFDETVNLQEGIYELTVTCKRLIHLDLAASVEEPIELKKGETHPFLNAQSLFVGEKTPGGNTNATPKFKLDLQESDKIEISSTSDAASLLRYEIMELGESFPANQTTAIEKAGIYTIRFFLDGEDRSLIQNILRGRPGILFNNIGMKRSIYLPPTPDDETSKESEKTSSVGNNEDVVNKLKEEEEEKRKAEEEKKKQEEEKKRWEEIIKGLQPDSTYRLADVTTQSFAFDEAVPSRMNIDKNNRQCQPIQNLNFVGRNERTLEPLDPQFWVYWIGVSDYAWEEYQNLNGKNSTSLMQQYAIALGDNPQDWSTRIPSFPFFPRDGDDNLHEAVEYAIVDDFNKNKFEKGEPYTAYNNIKSFRSKSDYGNALPPEATQQLHLCICNHNKLTPVKVYFHFETFAYALWF